MKVERIFMMSSTKEQFEIDIPNKFMQLQFATLLLPNENMP